MPAENIDEIDFDVLHPENPLMIRFQNALSLMLEKKLNSLQDNLIQSQSQIKKKQQEKEDLCEIIFNQKSELLKLDDAANEYNESISDIIEGRKRLKTNFSQTIKNNEEKQQALNDAQKLNTDLQNKIEIQSHVLNQLQEYEQNEASNLKIIQLAISKNKADQVNYLKEKIQKDCFLMKLENEVFQLELLIKSHKEQADIRCENLSKLQKTLDSKNLNFKEIIQDNSQLLKVWRHMVSLISKRDEEYSQLKMQLEKTEIWHKEKNAELNGFREMSENEMLRNESLTVDRNKKRNFLNSLEHLQIDLIRTLETTENELKDLESMIECTKKNLEETKLVQAEYDREMLLLENRLRKLTSEKYQLEENIISQLQNEVISNNATVKLNDDICELRQNCLKLELQIKDLNSNYFKTCVSLEQNIRAIEMNRLHMEKKTIEISETEKETFKIEEELKNLILLVKKEENRFDDANKQLHKLTEDPKVCPELDDKKNRIADLLKNITNEIEVKKQAWVQMQNEIMTMTERKSSLSSELSQLHQHISILRQKNIKTNQNLRKNTEEGVKLDKTISHMLDYISKLNNECSLQKQSEKLLDDENCTTQTKAMEKLQNAENEVLTIVQEVKNFHDKKEALEKELLEIQRKDLEWDKKVKLAIEMKKEILTEQSEKGDIGSMKNEIHRMEIRYAQLRKAQESLVSNLETCVSIRNRIFDDVILKERKQSDAVKEQQKIMRHIDVLKNKNLKLKERLDNYQTEHFYLNAEKEKLSGELKSYEIHVEILRNEIKDLNEKMQSCYLLKHKNLELLIRKQKLADFLSQIKDNQSRTAPASDANTERDFLKHQYLRQDLLDTVELIAKNYPDFRCDLSRIKNVLESSSE